MLVPATLMTAKGIGFPETVSYTAPSTAGPVDRSWAATAGAAIRAESNAMLDERMALIAGSVACPWPIGTVLGNA